MTAEGEEGQAGDARTVLANGDSTKAPMRPSKLIKEGDLVIIFMSRDKPPLPITVTPGSESTNTYGSFSHDSMIGLPFGAKVSLISAHCDWAAHSQFFRE
jgi:hypothetical protein